MQQNPSQNFILLLICALLLGACAKNKNEAVFYISPEGNDNQPGSIEMPFASLERAREAVRQLKQENGVPDGGITVYLREGIYPVQQTFHLTETDSGKEGSPVVYKAYPEETVRFVGGQVIQDFEPLSNEAVKNRINPDFRNKIWQTDLKAAGITDYGSIKPTGFSRDNQPAGLELFFNGEPMTIARYPNQGEWMKIASVPQSGEELISEGSDRVKRFGVPVGRHYGRFKYDENRPENWQQNNDIWLHGYWTHDWADSYVKVNQIDTEKNEFVLAAPHGVYGYTQAQRFYALNILEELDSAGEWYLDRETGMLYFWPPSPIEDGIAYVSVLENLMIHLDNTSHVRIEGFTFEGSRGEAIKISEGSHNLVAGCTVRNMGSTGITVEGGSYNGVAGCDVYNVGDGGIIIQGGDRETLTPAHNYAVNNHVHHYSRINKTYRSAISLSGVGNRLAHNYIHDAPHTGVLFTGNDNILEYNEVHDIAKETGDVGAFYIGRDWTKRGNIVRYNYFHHLHGPGLHGVMAVYLDDAASGTTIYGNVFYQSGRSAFIGGGHDNIVENNVFVACEPSVHLDGRGVDWASQYIKKGGSWNMYEKLEAVHHDAPPYSTKYPSLATILDLENPAMPHGNIIRTNISYGGTWLNINDEVDTTKVTIENNYVLGEVPGYINVEQGKLYPEDASVLSNLGFEKIPYDSIGLHTDAYRQSLPSKDQLATQ